MDGFGLFLKLFGTFCLFIGMCMAAHVSIKLYVPPLMGGGGYNNWYGLTYLGMAGPVIIFEILNMVAAHGVGWMKDKNLDMAWQAVNAVLALCCGFVFSVPVDSMWQKCTFLFNCENKYYYEYNLGALAFAIFSGIFFIIAAGHYMVQAKIQSAQQESSQVQVLPPRISNAAEGEDPTAQP